jgi:hypothetical protein
VKEKGSRVRVDASILMSIRSSVSDASRRANWAAQSKPCLSSTSPPGRGRASGAGEGAGIALDARALTRRSRTRADLSRGER